MNALTTVNEKTTMLITLAWFDEAGDPATPASATARIHDRATGTVIRAATPLTGLSTTKVVEITSAENAMVSPTASSEEHILTVEWDYGSGRHGSADYQWLVRNLPGVS